MKEAAGEANRTVITIVLIAIVLAVGTIIIRNVMDSTNKSSCCTSNGGVWNGGKCYASCLVDANGAKTNCTGSVPTTCPNDTSSGSNSNKVNGSNSGGNDSAGTVGDKDTTQVKPETSTK